MNLGEIFPRQSTQKWLHGEICIKLLKRLVILREFNYGAGDYGSPDLRLI
jgi:hypothetical protein